MSTAGARNTEGEDGPRTAPRWRWAPWLFGPAGIVVTAVLFLTLRGPLITVSTGEWLSLVGGTMGAIFAAAGLLLGLVSVITLLSLDDRIRSAYEQAHRELQPLFDLQVQAHITLLQAVTAGDWQTAERLIRDALQQYPRLSGARAYIQRWMEELDLTLAPGVLDLWALSNPAYMWVGDAPRWPTKVRFRVSAPPDGPRIADLSWWPELAEHRGDMAAPITVQRAHLPETVATACSRFRFVARCD